jgi:hypothetical protein
MRFKLYIQRSVHSFCHTSKAAVSTAGNIQCRAGLLLHAERKPLLPQRIQNSKDLQGFVIGDGVSIDQ